MGSFDDVQAQMRSDWDLRARVDAERAIYSRDAEGDVAGFAESGRANYDQLVRRRCQLGEPGLVVGAGSGWLGGSLVLCQVAVVAVPVIWFQVVDRVVISRR